MNYAWIGELGLAISFFSMIYLGIASLAVRARRRGPYPAATRLPRVSVLKPLCGAELETYECLRSVCDQDYPEFEVIFGVSEADDPAVAIAQRLQREFSARNVKIVVDRRQHGTNRKVSNLLNMMPSVSSDVLVLSDSDVRVPADYLSRVVAPLIDDGVGIVTCAYRGQPRRGFWSLLGALFINEWFLPSVCVAAATGSRSFAFGATIAIRRDVLSRIGGFSAIANQLADDYRLGELTRQLGLRTVLSDLIIETSVTEQSFKDLVRHELRWLRTIRALRPFGYVLCFVTFGMPVAVLGAVLAGGAKPAMEMLVLTAIARLVLHFRVSLPGSPVSHLLVLPFRDLLSVSLWLWGFATRRVQWRDDRYHVHRDGSVQLVARV
jgi:ceramide glucosyltransferase